MLVAISISLCNMNSAETWGRTFYCQAIAASYEQQEYTFQDGNKYWCPQLIVKPGMDRIHIESNLYSSQSKLPETICYTRPRCLCGHFSLSVADIIAWQSNKVLSAGADIIKRQKWLVWIVNDRSETISTINTFCHSASADSKHLKCGLTINVCEL